MTDGKFDSKGSNVGSSTTWAIAYAQVTTTPASNHTISYDANGGSGEMDNTTNIVAACTFTAPDNKAFASWNSEANGTGDTYAVGASVSGNITLYAQWATSYTVTYNAGAGSGTVPTESNKVEGGTFTVADQGSMVAPTGHAFGGWKDQGGVAYAAGDTYTVGTTNVVLTAQWIASASTSTDSKYASGTLTFANVGSPLTQSQTYWYNGLKFYEINTYSITSDKTKRWATALGNVPAYISSINSGSSWGAGTYNMSGLALQAHCLAIHVEEASELEVIVNMSGSGATIQPNNLKVFWDGTAYDAAYTDETYKAGTEITDTTWTRNRNVNNLKLTIRVTEEDLDAHAIPVIKISYIDAAVETPQQSQCFIYESVKVSALVTYTITYDLNGGTGTLPTETAKWEGATFTLHNGTTGITAPDGKVFDGWNDGTSTYLGEATYTMPAENVTLTAQWSARELSSDATLSALSVAGCTLNETFAPATEDYTITLPHYSTMPVAGDVTATKNESHAKTPVVTISGNVITIACKAEDNTEKTYTITVTITPATELVSISADTEWDWTKAGDATAQWSGSTNPTNAEEFNFADVLSNYDASFKANALSGIAQFANRDSYFQGYQLKFNTTVAGTVVVRYSNTGNKRPYRHIEVNGTLSAEGEADASAKNTEAFNVSAGDVTIKAYIPDASSPQAGNNDAVGYTMVRIYKVTFTKSGETALDNTKDEVKAIKRIENGMLVIEKNGKLYNAQGQEIR